MNMEYRLEYFGPIYHIFYKIIFIVFLVICSLKKISNAASSCFMRLSFKRSNFWIISELLRGKNSSKTLQQPTNTNLLQVSTFYKYTDLIVLYCIKQ